MKHLRNLFCFCFVAIVILTGIGTPALAHAQSMVTIGIVDVKSVLNLREQPTVNSASIDKLKKGTIVEVLSDKDVNGWYEVQYEDKHGYVSGDYLLTYTYEKSENEFVETQGFANVKSSLTLRSIPSPNGETLAKINKGEIVQIVAPKNNNWYEVYYNGKHGYVSANYLVVSSHMEFEMVAAYKTISSSSANRDFNMAKAAESINGTILKPGEVFDWFKVVGSCSKANGYKEATVIVNKKYVPGYGGGVCQVSSTLYNCIYRLNIVPNVHYHHSLQSSYVPKGMDATVSYPNANFVFTNTTDYTMLIEMYTEGGTVYGVIYKIPAE